MGNQATTASAASSSSSSNAPNTTAAQQEQQQQPSYYAMAKAAYSDLVHAIIRPPRCRYELHHLGPRLFDFRGKQFRRVDFELMNSRGLKIVCSLWEPTPECRHNKVLPCVIYMHGNSSARVEALTQLSLVLSLGATVVSFDFTGSGKSEGEWVSLGAFEKDDLKCVIEHLRGLGTTSTIALWGRSMGAATALLHGERDPSIAGMILDSAFADLQMLAEEMVEKGRQHGLFAPNFLVSIAIRMIRGSVQKEANFDIRTLCPIEHADKCFIPAMFVAAEGDDFVPPHHSQKIYQKYAGDKNILIVEGDHNSARPRFLFDSASIFLVHCLQIPPDWVMSDASSSSSSSRSVSSVPWGSSSSSRRGGGSSRSHPVAVAKPAAADEAAIGMTNERQADLRAKLYTMLGDRGAASANANANAASAASMSAATAATAASATTATAATTAATTTATAAATTAASSRRPAAPERSESVSSTAASIGKASCDASDDGSDDVATLCTDDVVLHHDSETPTPTDPEWTCDKCTLINAGMFDACFACDAPRAARAT